MIKFGHAPPPQKLAAPVSQDPGRADAEILRRACYIQSVRVYPMLLIRPVVLGRLRLGD